MRSDLWGVILDIVEPLEMAAAAMVADEPSYPRAWL
jgi:hypothetical protein